MTLIDEFFPDCVYRSPAVTELRGAAYRQFLTQVLAAFSDGRWTVEDQIAEGDKVVTRWSFTGIHRGNLMGIAPTGKQVTSSGVMIDRVVAGKITEEWEEYDALGIMQQLGAVAWPVGVSLKWHSGRIAGNSENSSPKTRTGDLGLVSQKSPVVIFLDLYVQRPTGLLFACS